MKNFEGGKIEELTDAGVLKHLSGRQAITECGKKLGALKRGVLVFEKRTTMDVAMDYCIRNYRRGGRNAAQPFAAKAPFPPDILDHTPLEVMLGTPSSA